MSTLPTHVQDVNAKSHGTRQRSFCVNRRYLRVWALVAVLCLSTVALLSHFGTPQWPQQKTPTLIDEDLVAAPAATQSSAKDEILHLTQTYPVAVWSKTYCPYSKRAKAILDEYTLKKPYFVVEADLRADAADIKQALAELTGRDTFPNVFVRGRSLGGANELGRLHASGRLKEILRDNGLLLE